MRYVSTRGRAPELGFGDVLLAGLATDGGLYVPAEWPQLPSVDELAAAPSYAVAAAMVMEPFVDDELDADTLLGLCVDAYATFRHDAVVPLVQIDRRQWVAELFHGPTLAFKDVALQLVGRLFDEILTRRDQRITVVGATSGDTGSAAIEGLRHSSRADIVMLYPVGGPSEVQRRQMTTVDAPNVRAVAVDGSFDDCQDLVKAMFLDEPFRAEQRLAAVNSINWARVMAQVVYYATTGATLRQPYTACVPTGNFGNIFAAWVAQRMGAPIADFVVASNANDILARFVNDADMSMRPVVATSSPSMDIQVSSNFERLLFELEGRDGARTAEALQQFRQRGTLPIAADRWHAWNGGSFRAASFDDAAVAAEIARVHAATGLLIDPHTATGTAAARTLGGDHPVVTMATAHAAKFPDVVAAATGVNPPLPAHLADLFERPERSLHCANDLTAVEELVRTEFS